MFEYDNEGIMETTAAYDNCKESIFVLGSETVEVGGLDRRLLLRVRV